MGIFWEVKGFAVPSSTFIFCSYSCNVLRTGVYMQGYLQVFCSLLASHASLLGLWTLLLGHVSIASMHKMSLWWNHWISTFSSMLYLFYGSWTWTLSVDFAHRWFCVILRQKLGLFLVFTVEKRAGRQENQQFCYSASRSTPLLVSKLLRYHFKRWRDKTLH